MSTTTYHLVVVKSVRDGADADPVHTAKKVKLAAGELVKFTDKNEDDLIAAFREVVDGTPAPAEEPAAAAEEGAAAEEPAAAAEEGAAAEGPEEEEEF